MKVWYKNRIDIDDPNINITVIDGVASSTGTPNFVRDRKNTTGWQTTDSTDAALTEFEVDFQSTFAISDIIILGHNLKNFTIQYFDGSIYQDFSPQIAPTTNTETDSHFIVNPVEATKVKIVINGTIVTDDDKRIAQLILTENLHQFVEQPEIEIELDRDRKSTTTLSGKSHLTRKIGGIKASIKRDNVTNSQDIEAIKRMYDSFYGFLVNFGGFNEDKFFKTGAKFGYRKQDIFLMKCRNELPAEYDEGFFNRGLNYDIRLIEVI